MPGRGRAGQHGFSHRLALGRGWQNTAIAFLGSVISLVSCFGTFVAHLGDAAFAVAVLAPPVALTVVQAAFLLARHDRLRPKVHLVRATEVKALLRAGWPFMLLALAVLLTYQADVIIVGVALGAEAAATFAVTLRIFTALASFYGPPLQQMWAVAAPYFAGNDIDAGVGAAKWMTRRIMLTAVPATLILAVATPPAVRAWTLPIYAPDLAFALIIAFWTIYNLFMTCVSTVLNAAGQVTPQAVAGLVMGLTSIPVSFVLARLLGLSGPILSSLALHALIFIPLYLILARRVLEPRAEASAPAPQASAKD